jgi:uncharacterized protein (TIGR02246 family)
MRQFAWAVAVAVLIVRALLVSSMPVAYADALDADATEAVKVANAYVDAFNNHDPHAFAMVFAENGDFVTGRGVSIHGRAAIEQYFSKSFSANLSTAHRTLAVKSAQAVSPGIVSIYAMSDQTGTKAADGTPNPLTSTFFVFVMTRQGGRWEIAVFHESNLPKPN